jgi:hypothetical protein
MNVVLLARYVCSVVMHMTATKGLMTTNKTLYVYNYTALIKLPPLPPLLVPLQTWISCHVKKDDEEG